MNGAMRVLVYSNCPLDAALGSGKVRLRLTEGLRARGHEVRVVEPREFEFGPRLRTGKRFRQAWGARRHARRALAAERWDVVEICGGEFGWLARWLKRRPRRPLLVHRTDGCELLVPPGPAVAGGGGWRPSAIGRMHSRLNRAAFAEADACVTLCELDARHLASALGFSADRLRTIPPGIDEEFLALPEPGPRAPRLAFLGSWIERKGVGELAAGAAEALAAAPGLELEAFGTSRDAGAVRAAFPEAVRARVLVSGRLAPEQLAAGLARASIFVFPTRYEGYGMATAEAMAAGCAVVTTPTGFGGDLRDGEDALLIPPGDAPALARAVRRLVGDDALRLRLARAGWRRVQSHRWAASVSALEAAYAGWLAEKAR